MPSTYAYLIVMSLPELPPLLKHTPKRLISIRLPDDLISEVKQKAKKQDVPYQQLIRQYIRQGLGAK